MAVSVDWGTRVITVPQADMTPLGGDVYQLDMDWLRLELKALEDDPDGMAFPDTHAHTPEVTISGVVYARGVNFINGYTVDITPAGGWVVSCTGANHNLQEVYNNLTGPTLLPNNSAGLIVAETGTSGLTPEESAQLEAIAKFSTNKVELSADRTTVTVYDDDGVTPFLVFDLSADLRTRTPA